MKNYKELKKKILRDRKVRKDYNNLGSQFEVIRTEILCHNLKVVNHQL